MQDSYSALLPHSTGPGSLLEVQPEPLEARDQDLAINSSVLYSLSGAGPGNFGIDVNTGQIRLIKELGEEIPSCSVAQSTVPIVLPPAHLLPS